MFDNKLRPRIDPFLNKLGAVLSRVGVSANGLSWAGFAIGIASALAIYTHSFWLGLILLLLSRLCDGLDGSVARIAGKTDLGGYLDIALDFAFYGLIPLAFVLADPVNNGVAGAVLLFVFYANGASFLTFALIAEKRGLHDDLRGSKSFLYSTGLAEATETITVFCLFCIFPAYFSMIAWVFSAIVVATTVSRFVLAHQNFKN